jgi:hypothetical protein
MYIFKYEGLIWLLKLSFSFSNAVTKGCCYVVMLECYLNCTLQTVHPLQGSMPLDHQVTRTFDTLGTHSPCMV